MSKTKAFPIKRSNLLETDGCFTIPLDDPERPVLMWQTNYDILRNCPLSLSDCRDVLACYREIQLRLLFIYVCNMRRCDGVTMYLEAIPFKNQKPPFSPSNLPAADRIIMVFESPDKLRDFSKIMNMAANGGDRYLSACLAQDRGPPATKRRKKEGDDEVSFDYVMSVSTLEAFQCIKAPYVFMDTSELVEAVSAHEGMPHIRCGPKDTIYKDDEDDDLEDHHIESWAGPAMLLKTLEKYGTYLGSTSVFTDTEYTISEETIKNRWIYRFSDRCKVDWKRHCYDGLWFIEPESTVQIARNRFKKEAITLDEYWQTREDRTLFIEFVKTREQRNPVYTLRQRCKFMFKAGVESGNVSKMLQHLMVMCIGVAAEESGEEKTFPTVFHRAALSYGTLKAPLKLQLYRKQFQLDPTSAFRANFLLYLYATGDTTFINETILLWILMMNVPNVERRHRGFVILVGPPGTTKTSIMDRVQDHLVDFMSRECLSPSSRSWTVPNHPSRFTVTFCDEMPAWLKFTVENGMAAKGVDTNDVLKSATTTGVASADICNYEKNPHTGKMERSLIEIHVCCEFLSVCTTNDVSVIGKAMRDRALLVFCLHSNVQKKNARTNQEMVVLKGLRDQLQEDNPSHFKEFLLYTTCRQYILDLSGHCGVKKDPDASVLIIIKSILRDYYNNSYLQDQQTVSARGSHGVFKVAKAHSAFRILLDLYFYRVLDETLEDGSIKKPTIGEECEYMLCNNVISVSDVIYALTSQTSNVQVTEPMREIVRYIKDQLLHVEAYVPVMQGDYYVVENYTMTVRIGRMNIDPAILNSKVPNGIKVLRSMKEVSCGNNCMLVKVEENGGLRIHSEIVNTVLSDSEREYIRQIYRFMSFLVDECIVMTSMDDRWYVMSSQRVLDVIQYGLPYEINGKIKFEFIMPRVRELYQLILKSKVFPDNIFSENETVDVISADFSEHIEELRAENIVDRYEAEDGTQYHRLCGMFLVNKSAIDACSSQENVNPDVKYNSSFVTKLLSKFITEPHLLGCSGNDGIRPDILEPSTDSKFYTLNEEEQKIPYRVKNPFYVPKTARKHSNYTADEKGFVFSTDRPSFDFCYTNDDGEVVYELPMSLDDLIVIANARRVLGKKELPDAYIPSKRLALINARSSSITPYELMVKDNIVEDTVRLGDINEDD